MNTEIETRKKLESHLAKLADLKRHIAYLDSLLQVSKWLTFLMYLAFTLSLYLGDILHLQTLITSFMGSSIGFVFYLVICGLLAYTLAGIKHAAYSHMAMFGRVVAIVAVVVSMGLLAEIFQSSGNQDTKARAIAEGSAEFKAAISSNPLAGMPTGGSSSLPFDEGELAKAKSYLANCKATCTFYRAKVAELNAKVSADKANSAEQSANLATITTAAVRAQGERLNAISDKGYNPSIRAIASMTGWAMATAIVVIMGFISAQFETLHWWLSEMKARALMALDGLQSTISRLEVDYYGTTGIEFDGLSHDGLEPITRPAKKPKQEDKPGFGFIPTGAPAMAESTVTAPLFRYQERTAESPENAPKRPSFGFIPAVTPSPASADADAPERIQGTVLQGTVREGENAPGNGDREQGKNPFTASAYARAAGARVGLEIACPHCGKQFIKRNAQHIFCSHNRKPRPDGGNCSDDWHNAQSPERVAALKAVSRKRGKST